MASSIQKTPALSKLDLPSDSVLLSRFVKARDEAAFKILVEKHTPLIMSVCRRILVNEHDVEDAFQATFMVLASKAKTIRISDSIVTWLFTVAQRISRRALMTRLKRRENELSQDISQENEVFKQIHDQELSTTLYEEIEKLPNKYRQPVLLCYITGMSQKEASAELCCTPASINARLSRGRKMLRRLLYKRGIMLGVALAVTGSSTVLSTTATAATPATALLVNNTVSACLAFTAGGKTAATTSSISYLISQGSAQMISSTIIRYTSITIFSTATALLLMLGWQFDHNDVVASPIKEKVQTIVVEEEPDSNQNADSSSFVAESVAKPDKDTRKTKSQPIEQIKTKGSVKIPRQVWNNSSRRHVEIRQIKDSTEAKKWLGEELFNQLKDKVDFKKKKLVIVTWLTDGHPDSYVKHRIESNAGTLKALLLAKDGGSIRYEFLNAKGKTSVLFVDNSFKARDNGTKGTMYLDGKKLDSTSKEGKQVLKWKSQWNTLKTQRNAQLQKKAKFTVYRIPKGGPIPALEKNHIAFFAIDKDLEVDSEINITYEKTKKK